MAATEIKEALKNSADTIARYIKDVATLTVTSSTQEVGSTAEPVLAARTVISIDGDNNSVLPTNKNTDGRLEIDSVLYDLHMQNVKSAIEYRAQMINALIGLLQSRLS